MFLTLSLVFKVSLAPDTKERKRKRETGFQKKCGLLRRRKKKKKNFLPTN